MKIIMKIYLYLNAMVYWGFTVFTFIMPNRIAELIGISLTNPIAISDFRAVYGGLSLGAGIIAILGTYREKWTGYAVFSMALLSAGLFQGRLLTIFTHGFTSNIYNTSAMAVEAFTVILGVYLLVKSDLKRSILGNDEV